VKSKKAIGILFLAWVLPGAGHYYLGYRWKGITFCSLLLMTYLTGMAMANFSLHREPYYLACQIFTGSFLLIGLTSGSYSPSPIWYPYGYHIGCLYTCVASFLNILIMINLSRDWEKKATVSNYPPYNPNC
jgi:hypothetical protein